MKSKQTKKPTVPFFTSEVADANIRSFIDVIKNELRSVLSTEHSLNFSQLASALRLLDRADKKAIIPTDSEKLRNEAINNFKSVNKRCGEINIDLDQAIIDDARDFIYEALKRSAAESYQARGDCSFGSVLDPVRLLKEWKFGPGSTVGTNGVETNFFDKITQGYPTVTVECRGLANLMRKLNPYLFAIDSELGTQLRVVLGSTLSTVPKNQEKHRTIASEADMNMALQLSAGGIIESALRLMGLDITTQDPKNNILAMIGSLTNGIATIDLKDASDLICILLIRLLWPEEWFHLLSTIRSPYTLVDGEPVKLNMMGTMGCGFTFPMMTLTLLSLVYATAPVKKKRFYVDYSTTGVYGDDIVVPVEQFDILCSTLKAAGLVVNTDKSYSDGPFRESCGGDYASGVEITPFYVTSLAQPADVYVATNQLIKWSSRTGIHLFRTFDFLTSLVGGKPFLVPEWMQDDSGVRFSGCPRRFRFLAPVPVVACFRLFSLSGGLLSACAAPPLWLSSGVPRGVLLACSRFARSRVRPGPSFRPVPRGSFVGPLVPRALVRLPLAGLSLLALSGTITIDSSGASLSFDRRDLRTTYEKRRSSLPKGWVDGSADSYVSADCVSAVVYLKR